MSILRVESLSKTYKQGVEALRDVSLSVEEGQLFGLLGPNGAGKTTLIKILLGLRRATGGTAQILGSPVGRSSARAHVGDLPEDHCLPPYLTGRQALRIYCMLQGLSPRRFRQRTDCLLDTLELLNRAGEKIRSYSKGMKQRLGLAQALLHEPRLVFLDEPTDGVDPAGRRVIRDLILQESERGATIFINSHLLNEVEQVCDRVAILKQGRVLREGTLQELLQVGACQHYRFELTEGGPPLENLLPNGVALLRTTDQEAIFGLQDESALDHLIDALRGAGRGIRGISRSQRTLEDYFIEVTGEDAE